MAVMGSEKHMHDDASPSINSSPKTNDEGLSKVIDVQNLPCMVVITKKDASGARVARKTPVGFSGRNIAVTGETLRIVCL
jgi:hypothetical protein